MKIVIAINDNNGTGSKLGEHFGHCPYFAIYETETEKLKIVKNEIDHSDQRLTPVDQMMKFKPEIVFTLGAGRRAIKLFKEREIKLKTGNYQTVQEVLENLSNLKDLETGCDH